MTIPQGAQEVTIKLPALEFEYDGARLWRTTISHVTLMDIRKTQPIILSDYHGEQGFPDHLTIREAEEFAAALLAAVIYAEGHQK